jgi:phosphoribosyl-ATP pyrophosphohydrolase
MELADLEAVLRDRLSADPAESYSAGLLRDPERAQRKIMEEAFELCLELGRPEGDRGRTAEEAADLLYHVLVGLVGAGVALDDVMTVLEGRRK